MNECDIFVAALEKDSLQERKAFLDESCAGNANLRQRIESLLESHGQAGNLLEHPALGASATVNPFQGEISTAGAVDGRDRPTTSPDAISLDFLAPADDPQALGRLGPYTVTETIGRGGMGIVLKAHDPKLKRVVAIKVLAPELAANPTARKRFLREAQAAAAVVHQHVVTIHAVDDDRLPYLVMECIDGQSLQEKIDRAGHLELKEILRIGQQIAAGLAAAHAHGLMHRDVKPANILLENGVERVRITDFGLARAVDDVGMTQPGQVAGTPQYMSPEQAQGLPMDARSDLFSLGCVLYAMCTGRPPFRAETTLGTIRRVCEEKPRPIREVNPDVPQWLVEIIDRLLAKQLAERFQSAQEVANLLGSYLAHVQHPATELPTIITGPARRTTSRPSGWSAWPPARSWAIAAAALACLFAGFGFSEATGVTHFAATVIRIFTPEGTLVVEIDDPAVKVTLEGDGDLVVSGAGPHELRLKPGNYRWKATHSGQVIKQELVEITRGGTRTVRVTREETGQTLARRESEGEKNKKASAAAPPLDPARPFVVLSSAGAVKRQLAGLQAAISEAASGDIIEICGEGPYLTPPSSAAGKALTIRAGQGFRPVLKLDLGQVGPEAKVTMLRTTAPLVVEGIEFHVYRSGLLPPPKTNSPLGQCTCLQADAAPLRVANCRFLGLGNVLAIDAQYTPDLEIRNSLLLSGNNALYASVRGPAQVRIENNLILADIAPLRLHVDGRQPDLTSVSIKRNTLLGYYAIAWSVHEWESSQEAQSKSATKLTRCEVAENLCCSQVTQALFNSCFDSDRPVKPRLPNPDELQQALRTLIEWNERDNGYSDHPLSSGQLVSTGDVSGKMHLLAKSLDDWNAFWGLKDTGSAVGAVRFIDGDVQQLMRSSKESLLPASFLLKNDSFGYRADKNQPNLGADVSLVGPGAAYELWQATPAYEEWRRSTNQAAATKLTAPATKPAAASTTAAPAVGPQPFVILGRDGRSEQKLATLAEAVLKSSEGDTIEIRGNGPFATEPIKLSSRRTIRAGQGFRPVISFDMANFTQGRQLLDIRAPLVLEGLDFQGDALQISPVTINSTGAPLYVANCRMIGCLLQARKSPACQLRNSQFSTAIGYAVILTGKTVTLDNNIAATGSSVPLHLPVESDQQIKLTRNVLSAGTRDAWSTGIVISFPASRPDQNAGLATLHLAHNIVSSPGGIVRANLNSPAEAPNRPRTATELERLPRECLAWHEGQNLYSTGTPLLSLSQFQGPVSKLVEPTQPINTLDEWNEFWGQSDTGSIQGAVRFHGGEAVYRAPHTLGPDDFRLRADSAGYRAGPGGKDLGPDINLVGPGAAYERWKQTPEYQTWLKDTGQLVAETSQPEAGAFVILSGSGAAERTCSTLADAVLKSRKDDTIEIRGNGPFVTPQLQISTALTIRAGAGHRPIISAAPDVAFLRPPHFVVASERLTLEGLEFQGPATGGSDCMLIVQDAPCYVANCQFRRCSLTASRALGYQVRNSYFSIARNASLIVSSNVPESVQVVENNLLTTSLSGGFGRGARVDIRHNLIMGPQFSIAVAGSNRSGEPLPAVLHASQNIIVGSPVLRFSEAASAPYRTTAASGAELETLLRSVINWREDQNLYSEGTKFLVLQCATRQASKSGFVFGAVEPTRPYNTLSEWNEFWGQSNTGAIQGRLLFQGGDAALAAPFTLQPDDFRLREGSAGYRAGPDGKDLGPDIDFVGPGAAYELWKETPEYQKWLEETGQKK